MEFAEIIKRKIIPILVFAVSVLFVFLILKIPYMAIIASTEFVFSGGLSVLIAIVLLFIVSSPIRASNFVVGSIYAFISGIIGCWFYFIINSADLENRNNLYWWVIIIAFGSTVAVKAFLGDKLVYWATKWLLSGDLALSYIRIEAQLSYDFFLSLLANQWGINRNDISLSRKIYKYVLYIPQKLFLFARKCLFLPSMRSYPIECAFADIVNAKFLKLRKLLKNNKTIGYNLLNSSIISFKNELELNILYLRYLNKADIFIEESKLEGIFYRSTEFYNLLIYIRLNNLCPRIDEIISDYISSFVVFRDLLEDKKTSLNLLATSISLWRSNTSIDYNELCVEVSEVSYNLSLIDYLSIIFISDKCVFEKLVPLALSFIRILTSNSLPNWCRSAVARIKAFCNAEISQSLSQKEVIRLVETEYNVSYYDTEIPQNILSPIEGIASFEKARRTGRFDKAKKIMPLKQIGINFGFDKIIFSLLVSASLFIFVYLFVYPTSKAIHVVKDLHRAEKYNQFELTSSDFDIASQTMIIGTNGGGLHRINLQNFRITTEKASKYTFPSNYVEKVQIKENKMLIKTNDGVENFENRGTGTSFKLKDNWITFVEPNSLKEINGNEISSIEDMGKNKLIVASGRIFVYENDRRVLKECKILNNEILNNEENMSSIVKKSYNEKTGICYILSSRANSDLFCNIFEISFVGDNYSIKLRKLNGEEIKDKIVSSVCKSGNLFILANDNSLHKFYENKLYYICGNNKNINKNKICFLNICEKPIPSLFTVLSSNNNSYEVRMCLLDKERLLPASPWADCLFKVEDGVSLMCGEENCPEPFIYWNKELESYELLIAKTDGFFRVTAPSFPVEEKAKSKLGVNNINLGGKLVWFDANEDEILTILEYSESETNDKYSEVDSINWKNLNNFSEMKTVLQKNYIGEGLKTGKSIAKIDKTDNLGFYLINSDGRIDSFDYKKHGWEKPFYISGNYLSASSNGANQAFLLDLSQHIYKLDLKIGTKQHTLEQVYENSKFRPDRFSNIKIVATEKDGLLLFFAKDDETLAMPWLYKFGENMDFCSWEKDNMPDESVLLDYGSLTRYNDKNGLGCLMGLDANNNLLYRIDNNWKYVCDKEKNVFRCDKIIVCEGGSFAKFKDTLYRLQFDQNEINTSVVLKNVANNEFQDEIISVFPWEFNSKKFLFLGAKNGLFQYNPIDDTWNTLKKYEGLNDWNFYSLDKTKYVWAVASKERIKHFLFISGDNVFETEVKDVIKIKPCDMGLIAFLSDKSVYFLRKDANKIMILPPECKEVGTGEIVKIYDINRSHFVGLLSNGNMFELKGTKDEIVKFVPKGVEGVILDFAVLKNKYMLLLSKVAGKTMLWQSSEFDSVGFKSVNDEATRKLERLDDGHIVAVDAKNNFCKVFSSNKSFSIADGKGNFANLGELNKNALFADNSVLYVAGKKGAAMHLINEKSFKNIENGSDIEAFEKVGDNIIGWKKNHVYPYILIKDKFQALGGTNHEGGEIALKTPLGTGLFIPSSKKIYVSGLNKTLDLFASDDKAKLNGKILDSTIINENTLAFKMEDGDLMFYKPYARSYSLKLSSKLIGKEWRFVKYKNVVYVSVKRDGVYDLYRITGEEKTFKSLLDVYQSPTNLYWLEDRKGELYVNRASGDSIRLGIRPKYSSCKITDVKKNGKFIDVSTSDGKLYSYSWFDCRLKKIDKATKPIATSSEEIKGKVSCLSWVKEGNEINLYAHSSNFYNEKIFLPVCVGEESFEVFLNVKFTGNECQEEPSLISKINEKDILINFLEKGLDKDFRTMILSMKLESKLRTNYKPKSFNYKGISVDIKNENTEIKLGERKLSILANTGRFSHEEFDYITTIGTGNELSLYTASKNSSSIVLQNWRRVGKQNETVIDNLVLLDVPGKVGVSCLKNYNEKLYVKTDRWYVREQGKWLASEPNLHVYGNGRNWNIDGNTLKIYRYRSEANLIKIDEVHYGFEAETVYADYDNNEAPFMFSDNNNLYYKTIRNNWYAYNYLSDRYVLDTRNYGNTKIKYLTHASGIVIPAKKPFYKADAVYYLSNRGNEALKFEMKLINGRVPHGIYDNVKISREGKLEFELRDFNGNSAIRSINPNETSSWLFTSGSTIEDYLYKQEEANNLKLSDNRSLYWEKDGQNHKFYLQIEKRGITDRVYLGNISKVGFSIFDVSKIVPITSYGKRIEYVFGSVAFSSYNGFNLFTLDTVKKFEKDIRAEKIKISIDGNGKIVATEDENLKPALKLKKFTLPILGYIDNNKLCKSAKSFESVYSRKTNDDFEITFASNEPKRAFTFRQQNDLPWYSDTEAMLSIAALPDNTLITSNKYGTSLDVWKWKEGRFYHSQSLPAYGEKGIISRVFSINNELYVVLNFNAIYKYDANNGVIKYDMDINKLDMPIYGENFGLRYFSNKQNLSFFLNNSEKLECRIDELKYLPRLSPKRVWSIDNKTILSDIYGNFDLSGELNIWESYDNSFSKKLGKYCYKNNDLSLINDLKSYETIEKNETTMYEKIFGNWNIKQTLRRSGKYDYDLLGNLGSFTISILSNSVKSANFDMKKIVDHSDSMYIVTDYGIEKYGAKSETLYNPDCQSFLSNLSKIKILQNQNDKYITAPYLSKCVSLSDFNRIKLPDDAKNYIYNNSSDTWKVEKDNTGQVLFNKYRRDNEGNGAFLRYSGDNLFVNGQFIFDKVENVFLHNELDLFVVKFADGNYDCVDLNGDKPKLVGLPVREYSSLNEYEYAFKNKKAVDNFVYKDNKVFINNLDLAISDSELGYVPNKHFNEQSVFKTYDERYWLTLPNSVVWIEGSKAWKSKLKKYRRKNNEENFSFIESIKFYLFYKFSICTN